MSTHRPRRIGRYSAERLLRGEARGPDQLAELLAAAAAPAERGELAGEEAAVAAFREAHLAPAPQQRRESMVKTALAKLLTLKVAAAAITATAAGGFALAAGTGHLPDSTGAAPTARPTPTSGTGTSHSTSKPSSAHGGRHGTSPSPSLVGLCHAYQAGAGSEHGKALDSPAFTHLISVAGGKDKVAAYCTDLLKSPSHGKAKASHPGDAATTHPHPTTAQSTHRNVAPTPPAKGRPTAHPVH